MALDQPRSPGRRARPAPSATTRAPTRRQARLAQQIFAYVQGQGFERGHHLTEESLAEHFHVSRSPIRAALRLLEDQGVLKSRPHQGVFVALSPGELQYRELQIPPSLEDAIYMRIAHDRFHHVLSGTNTEAELIRRYRVSRGLLLKVLARMSAEGLITRNQGQGWTFLPTLNTVEMTLASYNFRLAVEPTALLQAQYALSDDKLTALKARHLELLNSTHPRNATICFELDADFHETLVEASHNPFFVQAIETQNRLRRLGEYERYADQRRLVTWCREHLAILDALEHGDNQAAASLMAKHLTNAQGFVTKAQTS